MTDSSTDSNTSAKLKITKILIANRGEIAIRIARSIAELGLEGVAVFSEDDAGSLHCRQTRSVRPLKGRGASAYLNIDGIIEAAQSAGCEAIHPGYGFLSESADFARACEQAGVIFIGPDPETLDLFGDKQKALELARAHNVPVARGSAGGVDLDSAREFFASLGGKPAMLKAMAGGGGRGMRVLRNPEDLPGVLTGAVAEARAAFGRGEVYLEEYLENVRHIEVQIVADGRGALTHLGERECSLQRRNQKLIEYAPAPGLDPHLRDTIIAAALKLARARGYRNLGTFEFLVEAAGAKDSSFVFMEANPRLQVEHTVTEEIFGLDLVALQIRIAMGANLAQLGLAEAPTPRGQAMQLRLCAETITPEGDIKPAGGEITVFESPGGPGVRVDGYACQGYEPNPAFDSLLAKLIVFQSGSDFAALTRKTLRALGEFRIQGTPTNRDFLNNILKRPESRNGAFTTAFIEKHLDALVPTSPPEDEEAQRSVSSVSSSDSNDVQAPPGLLVIRAPVPGSVIRLNVQAGGEIKAGAALIILSAMKMEHEVSSESDGIVEKILIRPGDTLRENQALLFLRPLEGLADKNLKNREQDLDEIRPDLVEINSRHAATLDDARPRARAKRHKRGQRTARENIADLIDADSLAEYGGLALAAQRSRRTLKELIEMSPADGLVTGLASVNGDVFDAQAARCAVMSYDYTVFMGTQGAMNHKKTDRLLQVIEKLRLPLVLFAEGGGGRPGDVDVPVIAGLDLHTFTKYAHLSGLVPRIAVVAGRCFAGNAALAGCSDIIIATEDSTMGMGGPVMIKGGGLGNVRAEDVGPAESQAKNGVIDVLVKDESEAVAVARKALSYFQGPVEKFECADQRKLRFALPENRLRVYDIHALIETMADTGSVLELRRNFAPGMVTALVRVEGRPVGLIANNSRFLAGAIDADGADKASRFMQLCDAFDIPILSLCDTPGIMVGPDAEKTALVRHASRIFITAASVDVPFFSIVLRKGYGLGAMAMTGGSFHSAVFTVAWPSGEFGAMGLEGAVETGFTRELGAVKDWEERKKLFDKLVAESYERGKALNMASTLEIDDVIDPAESRRWIIRGLDSLPPGPNRSGKKRKMVDSW